MKLVVGLGNPTREHAGTRHNVGFDVVDVLASRWGVSLGTEKFHAWFGQGDIGGERVVLLKPTTYMNRSGRAVRGALRFYKLAPSDLLVIGDDMALPLGRLRLRTGGSAGGHKGLQDVMDQLGTDEWCRLRIGIGAPLGDPVRFVLTRFDREEEQVIDSARERAADAAACWVEFGADRTMTRFNAEPPSES